MVNVNKNNVFLAITISVIAIFLLPSVSLGKIDIGHYVKRIKISLSLEKSVIMAFIPDGKLKKILNLAIETKSTTSKLTYGLLTLSALNEMELVDMVISQDYKFEARKYFNRVLDERLNIVDHSINLASDLQTILSTTEAIKPSTVMLLNTFQITDKIINIFTAFENIKTMKIYDGLWVYFDSRNGGESHEVAWDDAKTIMSWAIKEKIKTRFASQKSKNKDNKLEKQFSVLFDKWGSHVSMYGVDENYKETIKEDLTNSLAFALNRYDLIQEEKYQEPSILDKAQIAIENIRKKTKEFKNTVIDIAIRAQKTITEKILTKQETNNRNTDTKNSKAISIELEKNINQKIKSLETIDKLEEIETKTDEISKLIIEETKKKPEDFNQEIEHKITLEEIQEIFDEISEKVDIISQEIEILVKEKRQITLKLAKIEDDKEIEKTVKKEEIMIEDDKKTKETVEIATSTIDCSKSNSSNTPKQEIIFNEIAWMGTKESSNNEWIELKNISKSSINLSDWQIFNENRKLSIIIEGNKTLESGGFFLLERTDDNSVETIEADIIYTGAIKNSKEELFLFDKNCNLQDKIIIASNWVYGDNNSKRTMERTNNLNWQTSNKIEGTPKHVNTNGYTPPHHSSHSSAPAQIKIIPQIIITEIQTGNSSSTANDFIEIYNYSDTPANIGKYQIKKRNSNGSDSSIVVFPKNTIIEPKHYFVWANSDFLDITPDITRTSTISSNNSLAIFDTNDIMIDSVSWGISTNPFEEGLSFPSNPDKEQSLSRKYATTTSLYIDTDNSSQDFEFLKPSPGSENIKIEPSKKILIVDFTYEPLSPVKNEDILFSINNSSTTETTSYLWDFGDGNSTTTKNSTTTHYFLDQGEFVVNLTTNQQTTTNSTSTTISIPDNATTTSVIINEIAWMGTEANSSDEWIELYNTTDTDIDLNGWSIGWNKTLINFTSSTTTNTVIGANNFYLIERTDDKTTSVSADWTGPFSKGLSNNGEKIKLKNNNNQIVDMVDFSSGWTSGVASPQYISMERGTNNTWENNNLIIKNGYDIKNNRINGTPKQQNSISITPTLVTELSFDNNITEITLSKKYHPYLINNNLSIPKDKKLIIEEGVIIKLNHDVKITVEGTIETPTTSTESIIFTSWKDDNYGGDTNNDASSTNPQAGDWEQIYFKNSIGSTLKNIIVKYGGRFIGTALPLKFLPSINIEGGSIEIKDSIIDNSLLIGISLDNTSSLLDNVTISNTITDYSIVTSPGKGLLIKKGSPTIQNCIIENNSVGIEIDNGNPVIDSCVLSGSSTTSTDSTGIQINNGNSYISNNNFQFYRRPINLSLLASPIFSNNIAQNNYLNGITLTGNKITSTTTWSADIPYIINSENINIKTSGSLIIQPGTIIKLRPKRRISIYGKLLAQGMLNQQIVFTTLGDDSFGGDTQEDNQKTLTWNDNWDGLHFYSSESILDNSIIKYGGTDFMNTLGAINITENNDILISNSIIKQNSYAFIMLPLPNKNSTTTAYCDLVKTKLNQLKVTNNFCSNNYDTYEVCPVAISEECK